MKSISRLIDDFSMEERIINIITIHGALTRKAIYWCFFDKENKNHDFERQSDYPSLLVSTLKDLKESKQVIYDEQTRLYSVINKARPNQEEYSNKIIKNYLHKYYDVIRCFELGDQIWMDDINS
jgi:competence protein ComGF